MGETIELEEREELQHGMRWARSFWLLERQCLCEDGPYLLSLWGYQLVAISVRRRVCLAELVEQESHVVAQNTVQFRLRTDKCVDRNVPDALISVLSCRGGRLEPALTCFVSAGNSRSVKSVIPRTPASRVSNVAGWTRRRIRRRVRWPRFYTSLNEGRHTDAIEYLDGLLSDYGLGR